MEYMWWTRGNVGQAAASVLGCVVPARTDGESETARARKSTKSIFVPLDLHPEHPQNTQTNVLR